MIVAGIGCRTEVSAEAVTALVREAVLTVMRRPDEPRRVDPRIKSAGDDDNDAGVQALAVPEFRRNEPGIAQAAAALGLPILWVAREALKGEQGRCLTRSVRAEAATGLSCIAEAAALAAAGPGSRLILPRIAGGGVTCALAEGQGA